MNKKLKLQTEVNEILNRPINTAEQSESSLNDLLYCLLPAFEWTLKHNHNAFIRSADNPPGNVEVRWITSVDTVKKLYDEICTMRRGGTRTEI